MTDDHRASLAAVLESGPIPAVHGVVRWRIVDLCQWIFEEFRVAVSQQTLGRVLRKMGYRKLSARPRHHAQAAGAIEAEIYAVIDIPVAAKRSPRCSTAQAILASLLAKATIATLRWARLISPFAHRPSGVSRSAT